MASERSPDGHFREEKLEVVSYVMQSRFWVGNQASGPDFGQILVGRASKEALRPAQRADSNQNPAEVQPGSPISGQESYCVT